MGDQALALLLGLLLLGTWSVAQDNSSSGTTDGSEEWGYTDVRPGAHLFWWLHNVDNANASAAPLVLWLQGGPGSSGVGVGNFEEFGPLDIKLKPNPYTWRQKAHLLFVDNPVGTGFSYVEDPSLLTTNVEEVTSDMMVFLQRFYKDHPALRTNPLHIFAQSYGGKFATCLGLALHNATRSGELDANFAGVALGNTWISALDSVMSWGPQLYAFSRVGKEGLEAIRSGTQDVVELVVSQKWSEAWDAWLSLEYLTRLVSNKVNFYNIQAPDYAAPAQEDGAPRSLHRTQKLRFQRHQAQVADFDDPDAQTDLPSLMNGPIRKKLGIIPANLTWVEVSPQVFDAHSADFMRDTISQVASLLEFGVNVTIFSGQLDLICATPGTEAWVQKLNWTHLTSFNAAERAPLYFGEPSTGGFVRRYKNLAFYWILNAGHAVAADQPRIALEMMGMITGT